MAISIKDIAKMANVSTATVSRVINGSSNITKKTKDKVLKVMEEMNYVPNSLARGLSNKKPLNVALLIDVEDSKAFYNPFFYEVMHGIEKIVYQKGLCLIIASSQKFDHRDTLEWLILGNRIQGIFIPNSLADNKIMKKLNDNNFPFVGIGEINGFNKASSWVDVNNVQGGELAVEHLLKQGYERIAFIGGSQEKLFNKNRLLGYKKALTKYGIKLNDNYIKECDDSKDDGYNKIIQLLSLETRPDSIICGDNIISYSAIKAISKIKLNIPNDMGIITFDDYPLASIVEPTITSINIDVFQMGELAANLLFNLIDNPSANQQQTLISTSVKERESTKRRK